MFTRLHRLHHRERRCEWNAAILRLPMRDAPAHAPRRVSLPTQKPKHEDEAAAASTMHKLRMRLDELRTQAMRHTLEDSAASKMLGEFVGCASGQQFTIVCTACRLNINASCCTQMKERQFPLSVEALTLVYKAFLDAYVRLQVLGLCMVWECEFSSSLCTPCRLHT